MNQTAVQQSSIVCIQPAYNWLIYPLEYIFIQSRMQQKSNASQMHVASRPTPDAITSFPPSTNWVLSTSSMHNDLKESSSWFRLKRNLRLAQRLFPQWNSIFSHSPTISCQLLCGVHSIMSAVSNSHQLIPSIWIMRLKSFHLNFSSKWSGKIEQFSAHRAALW